MALCNAGTRFAYGPVCKCKWGGIEAGRGGVDTALPWVQFDIAQAHDDGGGDWNHAMLTRKVFIDATNCKDAEQQAEYNLMKKRRAKLLCFGCTIKKGAGKRLGGRHVQIFNAVY